MANAYTAIADIVNPEVLGDQASAKFPDYLVLGQSNLVSVNSNFKLGSPGTEFKMPFFKRTTGFGKMEEGTALSTNKIGTGAEYAVVQRAGAAWEVYDTAELVSLADPVAEIAGQIGRHAAEYIDSALVTCLENTPNVLDITSETTKTWTQDTAINALIGTLGDNYQKMLAGGVIIMHSKVYGDLMKLAAIQNQYQSGMDVIRTGVVPTLNGLPILISDRCSVAAGSPNKYTSYIVGPEALGLFYQRQVMVEFDRDPLLQADLIVATVHFAPHLFGWDEKSDKQAAEDVKSIKAVMVVSQ